MPQGQDTGTGHADVEAWRTRIRIDAMGNYHYRMGEAIERLEGNHDAAIMHLKSCLGLDPDHLLAQGELIRIYEATGQEAEARRWREDARNRRPDFDAALALALAEDACDQGALDKAAEHVAAARACGANAESCLDIDANILMLRGLAVRRDRPAEALDLFRAAGGLRPSWTSPRRHMAGALDELGRPDEALAQWRTIADADPADGEANLKVGYALRCDGQSDRAIPYLERAVASRRGDDFALVHLGLALLLTDRPREAADAFQRCIELDSDSTQTALRGLANARLAIGDAQASLASCLEAERRFGRNPPHDRVIFLARMALDHLPQAQEIADTAEGSAVAAFAHALLDLDRGVSDATIDRWRHIAATAETPHARLVLAGLLAEQGRIVEAETELSAALQSVGGRFALRQVAQLPVAGRRLKLPDLPPVGTP